MMEKDEGGNPGILFPPGGHLIQMLVSKQYSNFYLHFQNVQKHLHYLDFCTDSRQRYRQIWVAEEIIKFQYCIIKIQDGRCLKYGVTIAKKQAI
jgi:hypothetical protein